MCIRDRVNAAKIALTGAKATDKMAYRHSGRPGGLKAVPYGELLASDPRKAVERAVWGMLPKNKLSRQLIKKLKVYSGPEHPHSAQKPQPYQIIQIAQDVYKRQVQILAAEVAVHQRVVLRFLDDRLDQRPAVGLHVGVVGGELAVHHLALGVVVLLEAEQADVAGHDARRAQGGHCLLYTSRCV